MLLLLYQIAVLVSLIVFLGILLRNLRDLPALPLKPLLARPFVSILVPARNEELNIERCLLSLFLQTYDNVEILVLDDGSTDRTWPILQSLQAKNGSRLKIYQGEPLPEGWHGKAWACHQLAAKAQGQLLLFTDADTTHKPEALSRAVAAMEDSGADMLSLTPCQETQTFWERLVVPLVYVILLCYLPLRLLSRSKNPAFCFAYGQFILFRSKFYKGIGGHSAVKNALVEDVWLCKAVKKSGGKVVAYNGVDAVSCRMYRNFREVIEGFSKNLFAGLGYSAPLLFILIVLTGLFHVVPWGFLALALAKGYTAPVLLLFPLMQITVALVCRVIIAVKCRQPLSMVWFHPLSQLVLIAIALNSFYQVKSGRGSEWKGRNYKFS
ncbi:MAG: glycosyltransferase [Chlorobiaceae bacterium]|jgi:chlorobactene glucosyltransferase|nr:glycosyltransferase [Chlorobiaceae bacterium]